MIITLSDVIAIPLFLRLASCATSPVSLYHSIQFRYIVIPLSVIASYYCHSFILVRVLGKFDHAKGGETVQCFISVPFVGLVSVLLRIACFTSAVLFSYFVSVLLAASLTSVLLASCFLFVLLFVCFVYSVLLYLSHANSLLACLSLFFLSLLFHGSLSSA